MAAPELSSFGHVSERTLVLQLQRGDELAFEMLYERYFRRIYRFVEKRLHNRADTEETVQEVFFNVFNSIGSYRGEAPLAAWIFGLTRRTIAGRFKKKRHATIPLGEEESERVDPLSTQVRLEPSPYEAYECQERIRRLEEAATSRLTDEQRALFRLHHIENRSITEIAETLSKTEDAVKSNLYRARKILLAR
ncbi:MAG: RNA polymerase sigma factor [Proteobacteria bacterium]|nr:RNA polymerase sigma factor [Pseudomonadota bacterium]